MGQGQRLTDSATQSARLHRSNRLAYRLAWNEPPIKLPRRVNGPPTRRRRLPVQRLPVAADARFPRGFQASAAWWGQPCAWNALATNAGSIPGLWSGVERSGVLHRFAFWPSRHHRREQAFVGRCERGRPSRGWLRTRRQAVPRWWMPSSMVLAQGTLLYRWRSATFGPKPCIALSLMQGTLRYRRRNATFGPEPCVVPVKRGASAYEPGKPTDGKWRDRRETSPLALVQVWVAGNRCPVPDDMTAPNQSGIRVSSPEQRLAQPRAA